jgi:autonomous glycyl radical cofactor GrcA
MKNQLRALVTMLALVVAPAVAGAQSLSYNSGQNVAPGYEGWEEAADGTKYFLFGYMNRNWEEELDVPVGPANGFTGPGAVAADQGQPTRFLPRRNRFVFRVKVPATFTAKDEMIWTLTTNGVTEKAYASLREDYKADDVVKASETGALGAGASSPEIRSNKPPVVKVEGSKTLTAKVGQPVSITALVTDDGIPKRRIGGLSGASVSRSNPASGAAGSGAAAPAPAAPATAAAPAAGAAAGASASPTPFRNAALLPPTRVTVGKNVGLHLSWLAYRAPVGAQVTYEPNQVKPWEDTRAGANSPWAPIWAPPAMSADGKVPVKVTFSEPGTYVLRGLADDGALTGYDEVTVTVTK